MRQLPQKQDTDCSRNKNSTQQGTTSETSSCCQSRPIPPTETTAHQKIHQRNDWKLIQHFKRYMTCCLGSTNPSTQSQRSNTRPKSQPRTCLEFHTFSRLFCPPSIAVSPPHAIPHSSLHL